MSLPPAGEQLKSRLDDRSAVVAVVGLGYVGLPLVNTIHGAGYRVLGYDIDPKKTEAIENNQPYIGYLTEVFRELSESDRFGATTDGGRLGEADVVLLCVPTPLGEHRDPDLSFVLESTRTVARALRPGQLVILESTTYPGTTRDEMMPILESSGLSCGSDFFLAFSPEREDPGRANTTTQSIPKVVGGVDDASSALAVAFYESIIDEVIAVDSAEIAEMSKLLENIFRAVNIAMVNELKTLLDAMGIDIWKVIAASSTKPFGFMPFYPGPGLGGHCIPIDPFYLAWKAKTIGQPTRFIELAGEVNAGMPRYVVDRLAQALNDASRALRGSRVLIIGISYKPNIADIRESPAAAIIDLLHDAGAEVAYHDPHMPSFPSMRKHDIELSSTPLTPESIAPFDAVVIVTNHDAVDYDLIGTHAKLVVDTRNAMASIDSPHATIIKA